MGLAITGRVVAFASDPAVAASDSESFAGTVWLGDDGLVAAVTRAGQAGPPALAAAPRVDVGDALVLPGLVDLHSHLAYAPLPLWAEPGRATPWLHHDSWPGAKTYAEQVTWPAYAYIEASPAELLAYAEVRALVGGTTSIQGSPPKNKPLDGWMVRNVEDERFGKLVPSDRVLASTLTLSGEDLAGRAGRMRDGATFIYHCAEGQPHSLVAREYDDARRCGCLQKGLVAIHTCAVDASAYDAWTADPGFVVWSPFSNLWLYGTTTDVPAALARGIGVCIGSDWGPSGTRDVVGELKVAQLVNADKGWGLSPHDLARMVTAVPGDALHRAWGLQAGRLQPGALADVVVIDPGAVADPFSALLAATERQVRLVVVGGVPRVGEPALMAAAGATGTTALEVAGEARALSMPRLDDPSTPWDFADVLARMEAVRADPKGQIEAAHVARARAATRSREDRGEPPLRLALDMPLGRVPVGGLPKDLGRIVVPPVPPLAHDDAFFASIHGRGFHAGVLDPLEEFYA